MIPIKSWKEFQGSVSQLTEISKPQDVLATILTLIRSNKKVFSNKPFDIYGFDDFIEIKEQELPLDYSTFVGEEISHFKRIILDYSAKNTKSLASYLRDTIEAIVLMEVDRKCPRCDFLAMYVYKSKETKRLCYLCKVCGYAEYEDGSLFKGPVEVPTTSELKEAGII